MKRTPLLTETKPRTSESVGITYLIGPPKPAEGMIGDIVVDVFTETYFIKNPTSWTTEVDDGLKRAIDASTLRLEHKTWKAITRAADISKAHYIIYSKMAESSTNACHREGTILRAGWSR